MSMQLVVGAGSALDSACANADTMGIFYSRIELSSADGHNFDLSPLIVHIPAETKVFIALDSRAVNYARLQLIAEVRLRGYRTFNLISPSATIGVNAVLKGNVYIGPGCHIGDDCMLGVGCWLERQVIVGTGARLGASSTLGHGVRLGAATSIGIGSSLGEWAITRSGTEVGRHCEWLLPTLLPERLPDKSFYDSCLPEGARVLNN